MIGTRSGTDLVTSTCLHKHCGIYQKNWQMIQSIKPSSEHLKQNMDKAIHDALRSLTAAYKGGLPRGD